MKAAAELGQHLAFLLTCGEHVDLQVHRADVDVLQLAGAILQRVPTAWCAYSHEGEDGTSGWLTCEAVTGDRELHWTVHRLEKPAGWQPLEGSTLGEAWRQAGDVLIDLMRAAGAKAAA